jgi:chromosome segregation ATPase
MTRILELEDDLAAARELNRELTERLTDAKKEKENADELIRILQCARDKYSNDAQEYKRQLEQLRKIECELDQRIERQNARIAELNRKLEQAARMIRAVIETEGEND